MPYDTVHTPVNVLEHTAAVLGEGLTAFRALGDFRVLPVRVQEPCAGDSPYRPRAHASATAVTSSRRDASFAFSARFCCDVRAYTSQSWNLPEKTLRPAV